MYKKPIKLIFISLLILLNSIRCNDSAGGTSDSDTNNDNTTTIKTAAITVTKVPSELREGEKRVIDILLTNTDDTNVSLTITSNNNSVRVNNSNSASLNYTHTDSVIEQSVTIQAVEDNNQTTETAKITISSNISSNITFDVKAIDNDSHLTLSIEPGDSEWGVASDADVVLTFSDIVDTGSWGTVAISSQDLETQSYDYQTCVQDCTWDGANTVLTINPKFLARGKEMTVNANGFYSEYSGLPFAETEVSFNVTSSNRPTVTFSPSDDSTDVTCDTDIILTFSEEMSETGWQVSIDGTDYTSGKWNDDGNVLSITPATVLPTNSYIYVYLYSFTAEIDDAPITGTTYFDFSTLPVSDYGDGKVFDDQYDNYWTKCRIGQDGTDCSGYANTYNYCNKSDNSCNYDSGSWSLKPSDEWPADATSDIYLACENLNTTSYASRTGWRVPTSSELKNFYDYVISNSDFIDYFPNAGLWDSYWTSTSSDDDEAYTIYFGDGSLNQSYKTSNYYLRCVSP